MYSQGRWTHQLKGIDHDFFEKINIFRAYELSLAFLWGKQPETLAAPREPILQASSIGGPPPPSTTWSLVVRGVTEPPPPLTIQSQVGSRFIWTLDNLPLFTLG